MKTLQQKIEFQKNKLVYFDKITEETATLIGRICISTRADYEAKRRDDRVSLEKKVDASISKLEIRYGL